MKDSAYESEPLLWTIETPGMDKKLGFGAGFKFQSPRDLSEVAKNLDEGVSICASKFFAGRDHLHAILLQADEFWKRGRKLARNGSIDLIMRATCQQQIARAIELSEVSHATLVCMFGIVANEESVEKSFGSIISKGATRDDSLLELTASKLAFLREFHHLPEKSSQTQKVEELLSEKSALLAFSSR